MSDNLLTLGLPAVSLTDPLVSLPQKPATPDQSDAETARLSRKPVSETSYTTPGIGDQNFDYESDIIGSGIQTYQGLGQEGYNGAGTYQVNGIFPAQKPIENPLHEYASYTYNLSLHMLAIDEYNEIINNNFKNTNPSPYVPKNVLISGAGRYNNTNFVRNQNFKEDFYFQDFKVQTVITPNMRNRNTNVIECSFTIIEPNGFTLINRMIKAANEINQKYIRAPGSYVQLPYVLQIDFFGYKETEDTKPEKIKDLTKIFPIKIVNVETSVKQNGAEYKFEAVPYNHGAYTQLNSTLPFNTKIQADTVTSAFNSTNVNTENVNSVVNLLNQRTTTEREIEQLRKNKDILYQNLSESDSAATSNRLDDIDTRLSTATAKLKELSNTTLDVESICSAYNKYYQSLKDRGEISLAPTYIVEFDEEIGKSKLFSGTQPVDASMAATSSDKKTDTQAAGGASKGNSLTYRSGTLNVPAGTTMDKLIDFIVRHSSYITDQILLPGQAKLTTQLQDSVERGDSVESIVSKLAKPLKWFKIVPTMKIGEWDNKQGRYVPEIILFRVKTYTISSKYPFAPRGRVPGYVKRYDYIFTGRNNDIIDWNIHFNTLYMMAVTAGLNKSIQGSTGAGLNPAGTAADPNSTLTGEALPTTGDQVAVPGVAPIAGNESATSITGGNTQKAIASSDLKNSLLLDARGDMIELDLKIIGDPLFIKQDDIFYSQAGEGENPAITPNKSLYMDSGELYIFVNFLSPVDYDEEKGLAEIKANDILGAVESPNLEYSNFSGVYKLITVDSTFTGGKFEQSLRMAKVLFDQLGLENNTVRQEQVKQLSIAVQTDTTRSARFTAPESTTNEFLSDVNATNSKLLNNFGLGENLLGQGLNLNQLSPIAGRITNAAQQTATAVEGTLSNLRGAPTAPAAVSPPTTPVTDIGFGTFQNPGE